MTNCTSIIYCCIILIYCCTNLLLVSLILVFHIMGLPTWAPDYCFHFSLFFFSNQRYSYGKNMSKKCLNPILWLINAFSSNLNTINLNNFPQTWWNIQVWQKTPDLEVETFFKKMNATEEGGINFWNKGFGQIFALVIGLEKLS